MSTPLKHQCPECGQDCYCALEDGEECVHECDSYDADDDEDGGRGRNPNACYSLWDSDSPGETD